jgi:uncharacterized protein YaeQ
VSAKYTFNLQSEDGRRDLPRKIIIGRQDTETVVHVALKLLAFVFFYRERLQIEVNLRTDSIPFVPDLVQLDYELRPVLWVECGECSVGKLHKLAVKAPEAELWIVKPSEAAARHLFEAMAKAELRRDRYNVLGLDHDMFGEFCGLIMERNELFWVRGDWDPPELKFDFNGLWFEAPFTVLRF